ncbi:hypothetical protein MAPG_09133 [Magnaporthiopsis poae ATCC 64411]|uniref:Zn(2)-C6 fungal-type domain-containing protein n=1 Tax=Magnaporthiopsis poae (strain ATCC 64411 / 73-15) TaxID=644358 RepID=A0A0C4E955_MAGP6|nr:hypothetical protein MAPG_09133 [Magnaporthiopsis poae ATCC 64411]
MPDSSPNSPLTDLSYGDSNAAPSSQGTRENSGRVRSVVVNRRSHAKSRTGCRTCKRRRIKCDENRPSCRNCVKHGVTCDFVQSDASAAATAASSHRDPSPLHSPCDINLMDLELVHNFTTFTCTTLASDPAARQLLRTTAVHMAVDCEYLMRSILAVSALHLSRYRPQKKTVYLQRAMQHHQAASSAAIELLTDLKAEECERLHLFSVLTVYYAMGCPVNEADLAPESPLIPNWLRLLHGMEPILHMLNPREYRGVLTPLFDFGRSRIQPFMGTTPPRDPSLLVDIQSLIRRTCTNPDLIPIYDNTIEHLRRMLGLILPQSRGAVAAADAMPESSTSTSAAAQPTWTKIEPWDILTWQWTQGRDFLPLLETVPPPQEAVVIFAHCLLVLKKLENQWWVEGWADHLMGKIWALLDDEHRHWIGWVIEEMGWIPPR